MENLKKYNIILGSKSPRRQQLFQELGLTFSVKTIETDELFPDTLKREQIPLFIAETKAKAFEETLSDTDLLITADTIVLLDNCVLGKPVDRADAVNILKKLSGRMHEVITAVCLKTKQKNISFFEITDVHFKVLSDAEINYYLDNYEPYDKAGAYGVQEWIGYIAVEKITGSFYNVMGLPIQKLYEQLKEL